MLKRLNWFKKMNVRNFEQHPNRLEQGIATSDESIFVICAHYVPTEH
jgi:hypothetical protein